MSRIAQHFFDRRVKTLHRNRTSKLSAIEFDVHRHFARTLRRRIDFLKAGRSFPDVLELGCGRWPVLAALIETDTISSRRIENYTLCDLSASVASATASDFRPLLPPNVRLAARGLDEELLDGAFPSNSFDAVFTSCSAHWVNNLDKYFQSIEDVLKPDGLFLGCMLGGESLVELNSSFLMAERSDIEEHGVSPHVSPFVGAEDVSNLLMNTGFKIPLVDTESCTKWFDSPLAAMRYVQRIGEGNALVVGVRKPYTRRATFHAAMRAYADTFAEEATPTEADPYATYVDDVVAAQRLEEAAESGEGFDFAVDTDDADDADAATRAPPATQPEEPPTGRQTTPASGTPKARAIPSQSGDAASTYDRMDAVMADAAAANARVMGAVAAAAAAQAARAAERLARRDQAAQGAAAAAGDANADAEPSESSAAGTPGADAGAPVAPDAPNRSADTDVVAPRLRERPIPATFEAVYWMAYKYHPSQPTPKARGAKAINLQDILSVHSDTGRPLVTEGTKERVLDNIKRSRAAALDAATRQPGVGGAARRAVASASTMLNVLTSLGEGAMSASRSDTARALGATARSGGSDAKLSAAARAALGLTTGDESPRAALPRVEPPKEQ